jgi:hypothetical protein
VAARRFIFQKIIQVVGSVVAETEKRRAAN